jgi:HEAT repeat protein
MRALSDNRHWVRWEASKALSQIGNQRSIQALLEALSDREFDVRWLAAEGLIRIGRKSLVPVLEALVEHYDSHWVREGIHHVLHDMNKGNLGKVLPPVLAALEGSESSLEVPLAARRALDALKKA